MFIVLFLGTSESLWPDDVLTEGKSDLVAKLQTSLGWATPCPTPRPSPTPTSTFTPTLTPTFTPSPTLTPTSTFTPTPLPTPTFTRVIPPPTATPVPAQIEEPPGSAPEWVAQEYEGAVAESPVIFGTPYTAAEVLSVQLVNDERQKAGSPLLSKHSVLDQIAQERSRHMAERGYFSHEDPDGGVLPLERLLTEHDFDYRQAGENIAYFLGPTQADILPPLSIQKWMDSPGHRDNMLDINYSLTGFGIASTQTGEGTIWYLTQVFVEN